MKSDNTVVAFDPGYSPISFSFMENISYLLKDYNQLKTPHQKKFKLSQLEPQIIELIKKCSAFYLGCILWGGYLSNRYKKSPAEISGNHTLKLSEEAKSNLDCAEETKFMAEYINLFNRDCKYYLNKQVKLPEIIHEILSSYNEFAQINNNFVNVKTTSDIKTPKIISHFEKLSESQLDDLKTKIYEVIDSKEIARLLEIGFYKNN